MKYYVLGWRYTNSKPKNTEGGYFLFYFLPEKCKTAIHENAEKNQSRTAKIGN